MANMNTECSVAVETNGLDKDKPLPGIMPAELFYKKRIEELRQAISRRADVSMAIPLEWVEEYNELVRKYG